MNPHIYDQSPDTDIAWCPACGNFPILTIVKQALAELDISPEQTVICSGIGQAAKTPHYLRCHYFNGLHGRALPVALGVKLTHPALTVIAESGDGDTYGEGGNHFIHTIRRNPDIVNIVHNNMVYGLTKGQASPTSEKGFVTPVQVHGVLLEPFNPIAVALSMGATFVARANAGNIAQAKEVVKRALRHRGYALVDIFQACVVFNQVNTYQWFQEHTYVLPEDYDPTNREEAFKKAFEPDKFALGVIYEKPGRETYEQQAREGDAPLYARECNETALADLLALYQ